MTKQHGKDRVCHFFLAKSRRSRPRGVGSWCITWCIIRWRISWGGSRVVWASALWIFKLLSPLIFVERVLCIFKDVIHCNIGVVGHDVVHRVDGGDIMNYGILLLLLQWFDLTLSSDLIFMILLDIIEFDFKLINDCNWSEVSQRRLLKAKG